MIIVNMLKILIIYGSAICEQRNTKFSPLRQRSDNNAHISDSKLIDLKDEHFTGRIPEFEHGIYEYIFERVLHSNGLNLNEYGLIAATLADVANKEIIFKIEYNDYLALENSGVCDIENHQRFLVNLVLQRDIGAPFNKSFEITAMVAGGSLRKSAARIILTVLRSKSPEFTEKKYIGHVTKDRDVIIENGSIKFKDNSSFDDMRLDISLEYEKYILIKVEDVIKFEFAEDIDLITLYGCPILRFNLYAEGHSPEMYTECDVELNIENLTLPLSENMA